MFITSMDRSHFYEANKIGLVFFLFFYDFWWTLQDLCFYRKKRKIKEKEKDFAWVWSSSQWCQPSCKDSAQVEKEAHQERLTRIWTFCIRNPVLFQKLLRPSHLFLSLWHLYIWNPIFLSILFPTPILPSQC
jgi:hypothetical protein